MASERRVKLLYDLLNTQPQQGSKRHGGGIYGEIIFFRMIERGEKFACFYNSEQWLNPKVSEACATNNIPLYDVKGTTVEDIVKANGFTRLYSCLPGPLATLTCCEVYGTVHGLREFETPFDSIFYLYPSSLMKKIKFTAQKFLKKHVHTLRHRRYLKRFFNGHFHLITVSEHSRYGFMSFFPEINEDMMKVFYSPNTSPKVPAKKIPGTEKYFMLVSGNRWEKNNLRAVMAFDKLISHGRISGVKMKMTGVTSKSFKYKIQNPDAFEFLGYVDDAELDSLYANAFVFVYPSLNEGFGYPPIEAMRYGVPVIASPLSSMAEICGGGALYFDPYSVEEIMNRMLMMHDPEVHAEFSRKALDQYAKVRTRQERDLDGLIDYITE